jgi:mannose-6-phosphate isomerase-like protein (cupin superfamily)
MNDKPPSQQVVPGHVGYAPDYKSQTHERVIGAMNALPGSEHNPFPSFLRGLPEADLPFEGLRRWLLQGQRGVVLLNESDVDVDVPEHSHGSQWGVILDGTIELTIGGETRVYRRGDTYFIPNGMKHRARIRPGFRALDFFEDPDRYRAKL